MYVFLFLRNNICTMITMGSKNSLLKFHPSLFYETAVFPHIRPTDISISHSLQMRVLFKNTTFSLHKIIRIAGIIRISVIIWGRALYEEIRYFSFLDQLIVWIQRQQFICNVKKDFDLIVIQSMQHQNGLIIDKETFLFYCKFQFKNCLWILVKTHKQKKYECGLSISC